MRDDQSGEAERQDAAERSHESYSIACSRRAKCRLSRLWCSIDEGCSEIEGKREGSIELEELLWRKAADIVGQNCLRKADKIVAMNTAVVLEPLLHTDKNLAVKAISPCVNGGTDYTREPGIEKKLTAYNDKNSGPSRVKRRGMPDSVEVATPHGMT
jgi:hypothetical protein